MIYKFSITLEKQEMLKGFNDMQIVEYLLAQQSRVEHLYDMRQASSNNYEQWTYYNNAYFEAVNELIDVKYMVVMRMMSK